MSKYAHYFDEWERLYREGESTVSIADTFGCSNAYVGVVLRRRGVTMRGHTGPHAKHYPEWKRLYEGGASSLEIGQQFDATPTSVLNALRSMGVQIRDKNDECYRVDPEEAFWSRVDKGAPDDCWLWTGGRKGADGYQYGSHYNGERTTGAHQFSYRLHHGDIPEGYDVAHKCDVRLCVNPSHLHAVPHKVNMQEAVERGRMATGSRQGSSKLTAEKVRTIRQRADKGESHSSLGRAFGVHRNHIGRIVRREQWKHV